MSMQLGGYPESTARYRIAAKPLNDNSLTENCMVTQEELKELLHYNPDTGIFTRIASRGSVKAGYIAGCLDKDGYITIKINCKTYKAHRLAWFYVHGKWPKHKIDHINHVRADNRIANLRCATCRENNKNSSLRKDNTSGVCGVCWYRPKKKWASQIMVNGMNVCLGYFTDKFEAICARKSADNKHGYHANHGSPK